MTKPNTKTGVLSTFTLLIWEEIPERTRIFFIPNEGIIDERLRKVLDKANGQIINTADMETDAAEVLNLLLTSKYPPTKDDLEHMVDWSSAWLGLFEQMEVKLPSLGNLGPDGKVVTHVYLSGFMM